MGVRTCGFKFGLQTWLGSRSGSNDSHRRNTNDDDDDDHDGDDLMMVTILR